jgi:hypothetical protein
MNPVHTFTPYFSKIHFNIIFPSMPRSLEQSSLQVFQPNIPKLELAKLHNYVILEVFTAMRVQVLVCWVVTHHYRASQSRRPQFEHFTTFSPIWQGFCNIFLQADHNMMYSSKTDRIRNST